MNWLDAVLIGILAVSIVASFAKGLAREVIGLVAAVAALLCGSWFYRMAGDVVRPWVGSREVANLCGFLLIVAAVIFLGLIFGWVVGGMIKGGKVFWGRARLWVGVVWARWGAWCGGAVITAIVASAPGVNAKTPPQAVVQSKVAPYIIDAAHAMTLAAPKELRDGFARRYNQVKRIWEDALKHGIPRRAPESEI